MRVSKKHTFPGGWSDELVASGVTVSGIRWTEDGIELSVTNESGHRFPTGEPGRALIISAVFLDDAGLETGRQEIRIERRVVLPVGRELGDTTLLPGETRIVSLQTPSTAHVGTRRARVMAVFDRLANLPVAHLTDGRNREFKLVDEELDWPDP